MHLQHDMVVTSELYAKQILRVAESDLFFSVAKLFFAYGLGNGLYFPLAAGGTSILLPGPPHPADDRQGQNRQRSEGANASDGKEWPRVGQLRIIELYLDRATEAHPSPGARP